MPSLDEMEFTAREQTAIAPMLINEAHINSSISSRFKTLVGVRL